MNFTNSVDFSSHLTLTPEFNFFLSLETSRMVFDSHNPAHHISINVPPPDGSHINEVDLKAIPELGRYDGLPRTFLLLHTTILLVTNRAIINEHFHKVCRCTIILWFQCSQCPLCLQVTLLIVLIERRQIRPTYGGKYHLTSCAAGQSLECHRSSQCSGV